MAFFRLGNNENVDWIQNGVIKVRLCLESAIYEHTTEDLDMDTWQTNHNIFYYNIMIRY